MNIYDSEIKMMKQYPSKLYVETTTRCNLRCSMCVKQAEGSRISDEDMGMDVFQSLLPAFPHLEGLILNGIGEPLLAPHIEEMITLARESMPADASISFQTNAILLTEKKANALIQAGLDTVCISVDMVSNDALLHGGEDVSKTTHVFSHLRKAAEASGRSIRIGVEFVLMRDTAESLPRSLQWAAKQGADFALVTHMFPYCETMSGQELFNPNTDKSMKEYAKWKQEADEKGIDFTPYFGLPWKFSKTEKEAELVEFVHTRRKDAINRDIPIHFTQLMDWSTPEKLADQEWLASILSDAQKIADNCGLEVALPPVAAKHERQCDFVEQSVAHITPTGDVRPCYFLWHEYSCFMDGITKKVEPRTFGNVTEASIIDIWNSEAYTAFRTDVLEYAYPYCSNCSVMPCSDVTGQGRPFEQDCIGTNVPCGHCIWCMGGVRCLL
jgi:putative metalloenzyme radical SAM/SPASM domain maturase